MNSRVTLGQTIVGRTINGGRSLCGFGAVQTVRGILDGEEYDIGVRGRFGRVDHVRRHVDDRAWLGHDFAVADLGAKGALKDVDPLLVRVRVRHRAGTGRHAHERDDHAVALDYAALDRGIIRPALDAIHSGKVEQVFAGARALGAGGTGWCWLAR